MESAQVWNKVKNGVFVVAELGKNFIQTEEDRPVEEYLRNAKELVRLAKESDADAVKFQTHNLEDEQLNVQIVAPHFKGERYSWVARNNRATPIGAFWRPLKKYCDELGIVFFSTPMSRGAAKILDEVGVELWKVASSDILDFPLLDYVRQSRKPVILSSGMSTVEEIDKAVNYILEKNNKVALLHCVSIYPCPPEKLNLGTIGFLKKRYGIPVGFSDHSIGTDSALAAVALGAKIIEKHFSTSREHWGSDHKVSMTPEELKILVAGIRELEVNPAKKDEYLNKEIAKAGMGLGEKSVEPDELKFVPVMRKGLMAGLDIPVGSVITADMLYAMRPQKYALELGALQSEHYEKVLGRKLKKALKRFDPITEDALS